MTWLHNTLSLSQYRRGCETPTEEPYKRYD